MDAGKDVCVWGEGLFSEVCKVLFKALPWGVEVGGPPSAHHGIALLDVLRGAFPLSEIIGLTGFHDHYL